MTAGGTPMTDLRSKEHRALFDIIDRLRSHGIGEVIDLPEIIVCGDQSAGKSSVLEAISGHPFPTKDGVCTRFVTELVLRREPKHKFKVSISPGPERAPKDAERLRAFSDAIGNEQRLDKVVEAAKEAMGLSDSKRFSTDVLRVEICGPDQAHLTMVDLPGIFRAGSSEQSVEDVQTVSTMVRKAMARPRSIILAVVSASNEFNNQEITELARKLDPGRTRTLGLITKPDRLDENTPSEKFYIKLARNQEAHLDLGWHVLRNRGSKEKDQGYTRDKVEELFFSQGAWRSVDPSHLGVSALRKRLSIVLGKQILEHLPSLCEDVLDRTRECEDILARLGDPRSGVEEQRRYLLGVSRRFSALMTAAIEGNDGDSFFGDAMTEAGYNKRIRAVVQNMLIGFNKTMQAKGKLQHIIDDEEDSTSYPATPERISRSDYLEQVTTLMNRSRGRELPGTFSPLIIRELFRKQCQPWKELAEGAMIEIVSAVSRMALAALRHVALGETIGAILAIIEVGIEKRRDQLNSKLQEILTPHYECHPITYNHYLTDMVQKAQSQRRAQAMKKAIALSVPNHTYQRELTKAMGKSSTIMDGMERSYNIPIEQVARVFSEFETLEADMEKQASGTATDYSEAYYKVALKRFIDDFANLAVEQQLIRHLPNLFTPEMIFDLTNEQVSTLASEDEQAAAERTRCKELLSALQKSTEDLRRLRGARINNNNNGIGVVDAHRPATPPSPASPIARSASTSPIGGQSRTPSVGLCESDSPGPPVAEAGMMVDSLSPTKCPEEYWKTEIPLNDHSLDGWGWGWGAKTAKAGKKKAKKIPLTPPGPPPPPRFEPEAPPEPAPEPYAEPAPKPAPEPKPQPDDDPWGV